MSVHIKPPPSGGDPPKIDALTRRIAALLPEMRGEIQGLREDVEELRDEVRQLRGERSEAAMLSVPEASDVAGISERTMRTLIHAGEVPSARIGRRLLVPRAAFHAWLESKVEGGA